MKLLLCFILLSVLNVSGNIYSQNGSLHLNVESKTVKEVFQDIEKQSQYRFLYNDDFIDLKRLVSLNTKDKNINELLNELLSGANLTYKEMANNLIVITPLTSENQDNVITGRVIDLQNNETLVGVNIHVRGTIIGTVTDINGNYTITVPDDEAYLVFSFVGYQSETRQVEGQKIINVELVPSIQGLDEVVVVGYGTRLREELTGSVSTMSGEKMQLSTAPTAIGRLQGQVSGVHVTTSNVPGGSAMIRIRGLGTIHDNDPLYIIDGIPASPDNNLNPNDIESISILKDASSAAIYGTRGANGVVIISTKKGRENQRATVSFNAKTGFSQAVNQIDLLNTQEYGEFLWMEARNMGYTPGVDWSHAQYGNGTQPRIPDYILPNGAMEGDPGTDISSYSYPGNQIFMANKTGTNWFDEIYQNAMMQEYDMNVRGGGENTTYAFSGSYLNEEGILKNTGFERYTFRNNADSRFTDWLKAGQSLQVSYTKTSGNRADNDFEAIFSHAYRSLPIIPVYDIAGNYAGSRPASMGNSQNPVAALERQANNTGSNFRILGSIYGSVDIYRGLEFKSTLGYNFIQYKGLARTLVNPEHSEPTMTNSLNRSDNTSMQWNWSNVLNYSTVISDDHRLNVTLGTEAINNHYDWMNASRTNYFSENPDYMHLSAGEQNQQNEGLVEEWTLFSVFGRVNYDLMGKYLFEATVRRDGSSRFGPKNRYANFPAASLAWNISRENFMAGTRNWLDIMKLRFGWGISGNDRIGNYSVYTTYEGHMADAGYDIDGTNTQTRMGFRPRNLGNTNVTWETTETFNTGLDLTLLNNSLHFSADVWQRYTSDMLYRLPMPIVMGNARAPYVNIAEMKNTGFDLEFGYNNTAVGGKFRYAATATISRYKNEITKLSEDVDEYMTHSNPRASGARSQAGTSYPEFFGYIVDGIFQTQAEADAHPAFGNYNKPGRLIFRDVDGDGEITPEDRTYIGSPHPDFTGGLNLDLGYGNFDLNMFFYGSYGNDMINHLTERITYGRFVGGRSKEALYNSWGSPYLENNADATVAIIDGNIRTWEPSTHFIEDGSFLRLKSLRLGYRVPRDLTGRMQIQSLRIYLQATNLFTITNYSGLDPELHQPGGMMGIDQGSWPTPRQIMFGVSLDL